VPDYPAVPTQTTGWPRVSGTGLWPSTGALLACAFQQRYQADVQTMPGS
jgi:hypothetical protein